MSDHVKVLGILGIARAALGTALGIVLITKAMGLSAASYGLTPAAPETLRFDSLAFLALGIACLTFALLRLLQGGLALRGSRPARGFGLGLAFLDLANILLFPLSTALGLYGLVVYRHPDTVDHFASRALATRLSP